MLKIHSDRVEHHDGHNCRGRLFKPNLSQICGLLRLVGKVENVIDNRKALECLIEDKHENGCVQELRNENQIHDKDNLF